MNYDWLFSFVTFAEHKNFTRAAKDLHLSQPALHVQIRKLSEAVGRPLYRKKGRNLFLTTDGERLAAFGRQVREQGENLIAAIGGGVSTGPLILASGQGAFLYLLEKPLRRFPKHRWPLRLETKTGPDAIEAVRAAKAHLGVIATDTPPEDLDIRQLCKVGQSVILPTSHRLAGRMRLRPVDRADEPIVAAPKGSPHRNMLAQLLSAAGAKLTVAVEATGWELMLAFARYGVGITVVNDFCPAPRGMKAIPLVGAPHVTYFAISRHGIRSEAQKTMVDLIERELARR